MHHKKVSIQPKNLILLFVELSRLQTTSGKKNMQGYLQAFHFWSGVFQRPLALTLLKEYRDTNGRCIVIQIGGAYVLLSAKRGAYFCAKVSR